MMSEIISYINLKTLKGLGENDWQGLDMSAVMAQENCHNKRNADYSNPKRIKMDQKFKFN